MRRAVLIAAVLATSAQAAFYDGNKLLSRLQDRSGTNYLAALNYVMGVSDAFHGVTHCAPETVTAGQITDMVQRHLENLPSVRHHAADLHIEYVLRQAWPCADRKSKASGV